MSRLFWTIAFLSSVMFFSCEEEIRTDLQNQVLIKSYVHHGRKSNILEIRLFKPLGKDKESPLFTPQSTQIVNLSKNVIVFPEFESTGIYILNSDQLKLGEEDILELKIQYNQETILARTKIPSAPRDIQLSDSILKLYYLVDALPERINLNWSNDDQDYFLVKIDTASSNPEEILAERIAEDISNPYVNRVGVPIKLNEIEISFPSVRYFGRHRLVLFHITKDFYDLYNNPVQGSYNKLNQSVVNGLGIFSATNSDTLFFQVVK